jgi:hypothetical protein
MDFDGGAPDLAGAKIDRDVVVYGESRIHYFEEVDNSLQEYCVAVAGINGWVEAEGPDAGCIGCSEDFTLAFLQSDESSCEHSYPSGTATLAITPLQYFPVEEYPALWDWLREGDPPPGADGDAVAFAYTNWLPAGGTEYLPYLGIYPPAESTGLESYEREYYVRTRSGYVVSYTQHGWTTWEMDLWLTD